MLPQARRLLKARSRAMSHSQRPENTASSAEKSASTHSTKGARRLWRYAQRRLGYWAQQVRHHILRPHTVVYGSTFAALAGGQHCAQLAQPGQPPDLRSVLFLQDMQADSESPIARWIVEAGLPTARVSTDTTNTLRDAWLRSARRVVLAAATDEHNLQLAKRIATAPLVSEERAVPEVLLCLESECLALGCLGHEGLRRLHELGKLHFIHPQQDNARQLLQRHAPHRLLGAEYLRAQQSNACHIGIVGHGPFARALILQARRVLIYAPDVPLRISLFVRDVAGAQAALRAMFAQLGPHAPAEAATYPNADPLLELQLYDLSNRTPIEALEEAIAHGPGLSTLYLVEDELSPLTPARLAWQKALSTLACKPRTALNLVVCPAPQLAGWAQRAGLAAPPYQRTQASPRPEAPEAPEASPKPSPRARPESNPEEGPGETTGHGSASSSGPRSHSTSRATTDHDLDNTPRADVHTHFFERYRWGRLLDELLNTSPTGARHSRRSTTGDPDRLAQRLWWRYAFRQSETGARFESELASKRWRKLGPDQRWSYRLAADHGALKLHLLRTKRRPDCQCTVKGQLTEPEVLEWLARLEHRRLQCVRATDPRYRTPQKKISLPPGGAPSLESAYEALSQGTQRQRQMAAEEQLLAATDVFTR